MESDLLQFTKQLTEENMTLYRDLMKKEMETAELKRVIGQLEGIKNYLEFRLNDAERRLHEYEQR